MTMKTLKIIVTHPQTPSIIDQTMHDMEIVKGRVDIEIECIDKSNRFTRYNNISLSSQNRLVYLINTYPNCVKYKDGKLILRRR